MTAAHNQFRSRRVAVILLIVVLPDITITTHELHPLQNHIRCRPGNICMYRMCLGHHTVSGPHTVNIHMVILMSQVQESGSCHGYERGYLTENHGGIKVLINQPATSYPLPCIVKKHIKGALKDAYHMS